VGRPLRDEIGLDGSLLRPSVEDVTAALAHAAPAARRKCPTSAAELFERLQETGDARVREELVKRYLPLARSVAKRYMTRSEPFDDLVQVATVGLLAAVERFDPFRGSTFASFAVPTMVGEVKRYFRDCGWAVHVPRGAQDLALKVERGQRELERTIGRSPNVADLAEYLELTQDDVVEALQTCSAHYAASLDAPRELDDEEPIAPVDALGEADDGFDRVNDRTTISSLTRDLPTRERRVLALRFARELTQAQIGERIGVSQMQVSRILRRSLDDLHALSESCDGALALREGVGDGA
jgi:RNA polymerase sigma-B factor